MEHVVRLNDRADGVVKGADGEVDRADGEVDGVG